MDTQQARIWMAMDIGPLWIGRDDEDPLSPAAIMRDAPAEHKVDVQPQVPPQSVLRPQTPDQTPVQQSTGWGMPQQPTPEVQKPVAPATIASAQAKEPAKPIHRLDSPGTGKIESHQLTPIRPPKDQPGEVTQKPVSNADIAQADWTQLRDYVSQCQACQAMCKTRLSTVFGTMEPTAQMVIVGEAPGRDEDIQGKPFVGKSGELLENILMALGLQRGKDVAIINVLKCRPPNNRDPHPEEIAMCRPYLERQLSLLSPKVVILSGRIAAHALLGTEASMKQLRQTPHTLTINGVETPVIVTYHPSYLLRSPSDKLEAWRDFMAAKHRLLGI